MEKAEALVAERVAIERSTHKPTHYEPSTAAAKDLDRKVNLKLDFIIVSVLAIDFILCGIDKTNIGYAATTNFAQEANLRRDDISDSVSLLSVTFITLQPFSAALGRRIGPKWYIPLMMLLWGTFCAAHAAVKNRGALIALRLLLGAAEAGFVPTTFHYLSTLYPKYFLGFRLGLFCGMYSIAGAFAGLIAYGVFQIRSSKLYDWQILFVLEGVVSIFMAFVTLLVIPAKLDAAWFLSEDERAHAVYRLQADVDEEFHDDGRFSKRDVIDAVTDWRKLLTVTFNILATLPVQAFATFMPLIVRGMGYSGVDASLMSVSPFVVGACGLFAVVYSSDHFRERSIHVALSMVLCVVGLIVMYVSDNAKLRYGFVHVCLAGAFNAGPLVVAWLAGNTPDRGVRAITIGINGYSNIAGVIAGQLFKVSYGPHYKYPLKVTMVLISTGAVGFMIIRGLYMYINRSRQRQTANWTDAEFLEELRNDKRRGDQKLTFVYGY